MFWLTTHCKPFSFVLLLNILRFLACASFQRIFVPVGSSTVLSISASPSGNTSRCCPRLDFPNCTSAHGVGISPTGFPYSTNILHVHSELSWIIVFKRKMPCACSHGILSDCLSHKAIVIHYLAIAFYYHI